MTRSVHLSPNLTTSWTRKAKCGNSAPEPSSSSAGTETLATSTARLLTEVAGTESQASGMLPMVGALRTGRLVRLLVNTTNLCSHPPIRWIFLGF